MSKPRASHPRPLPSGGRFSMPTRKRKKKERKLLPIRLCCPIHVLPCFSRYHFWVESYANPDWPNRDWTTATLKAEYDETKAWALHMYADHPNRP